MTGASHRLVVPSNHPTFDGHFPDNPILPGAALLDLVRDAARLGAGWHILSFPSAKFVKPIGPGDEIVIEFEPSGGGRARFSCRRKGDIVATGMLTFGPIP